MRQKCDGMQTGSASPRRSRVRLAAVELIDRFHQIGPAALKPTDLISRGAKRHLEGWPLAGLAYGPPSSQRLATINVHCERLPEYQNGPSVIWPILNMERTTGLTQVQAAFDNLPASVGRIRVGELRAPAITSAMRSGALPNVLKLVDFLRGYEVSAFY